MQQAFKGLDWGLGLNSANSVPSLLVPPPTQEVEAGRSDVQGRPRPHSKFETNLGYMRPILKQTNKRGQLGPRAKRETGLPVTVISKSPLCLSQTEP